MISRREFQELTAGVGASLALMPQILASLTSNAE
jgi:hypothetical protein